MFTDPMLLFAAEAQGLDVASERLSRALPLQLQRREQAIDTLQNRLLVAGKTLTDRFDYRMRAQAARLEDLSPISTIARGYSITRDEAGHVVSKVAQAPVGANVDVMLSDGTLSCQVYEVRES